MPKVSVIIPVYNVEKHIAKCAHSLFSQTLDDIEFIFVNDCTKDRSIDIMMKVLGQYPKRHSQVTVLTHKKNAGQAEARSTGMKAAKGEYMIHCDPDDWIDVDLYDKMYNKAIEARSDIVTCGFIKEYDNGNKQLFQCNLLSKKPKENIKNSFKSKDPFFCVLWNKLVKTSLIQTHNSYPILGANVGEDLLVSYQADFYANYIASIDNSYYHYCVSNPNSITRKPSISIWQQVETNINAVTSFLMRNGGHQFQKACNYLKFSQKTAWLLTGNEDWTLWERTYPEANKTSDIITYQRYPLKQRIFFCLKLHHAEKTIQLWNKIKSFTN